MAKKILALCLLMTFMFSACAPTDRSFDAKPDSPGTAENPSQAETDAAEAVPDAGKDSIRKRYGLIDLGDEQATEEEKRLMCLVWLNMMDQSWESPGKIDPDYLIHFFVRLSSEPYNETEIKADEWESIEEIGPLMPAAVVEPAIQRHFDVSSDYLRDSMFYVVEKDAYWLGGLGSLANARIVDSKVEETLHAITYELYHDIELTGTGILKIEMNGGEDYRYLSNEFTPIPLTPEQQERKDSFIEIGKGLTLEEKVAAALVCTGNAYTTWHRADERPQYDLLSLYDFMVQIGEVAIPEGVERDPYWKDPYLPAADVEAVVTSYYDVGVDYLREYRRYDPESGTYRVPSSSMQNIRLAETRRDGDLLLVRFEVYYNYELAHSGEITAVVLEEDGFQYISCVVP